MTNIRLRNSISILVEWALHHPNKPVKTSTHVAALIYRERILIDPINGNLIAKINQRDGCAERQLLWLCQKMRRKQP